MDEKVNVPNQDGKATASLVLGIISVVGCFIPYVSYAALVCGILAIVFSTKAKKNISAEKKGVCNAGFVLGIIGTSLCVLGVICAICALGALGSALGELSTYQ